MKDLIKKTGLSLLVLLFLTTTYISFAEPPGGIVDPQCSAGGPNASSCEYESTIPGIGGGSSCSVTCNSPSYACCYEILFKVYCKCKGGGAAS